MIIDKVYKKVIGKMRRLTKIIGASTKTELSCEEAEKRLQTLSPDPKTTCFVEETGVYYQEGVKHCQLSIILCTYNRSVFLKSAVESVLCQSREYDWELVIVNDGSTDDTQDILKAWEGNDRVVIIHQANRGFAGARNAGIDRARGDYLTFLDDDDELTPNAVSSLLGTALRYDADLVEGSFIISKNGRRKQERIADTVKKVEPLGNLSGFWCGKAYRRDCLKGIRLPEKYWYEDSLNAEILFHICKKCFMIPDAVYLYVQHENNAFHELPRKPKTIDSFYITRQLMTEKKKRGFSFGQPEYEYFLLMIKLTHERTCRMPREIQESIFVLQCALAEEFYRGFQTRSSAYKKAETALREHNFRKYLLACEL